MKDDNKTMIDFNNMTPAQYYGLINSGELSSRDKTAIKDFRAEIEKTLKSFYQQSRERGKA